MLVTFEDYTPVPREDGDPWTGVTIFQSASEDGPWTAIDDITFAELDTDPANPVSRSFSTPDATLNPGWYKVRFVDADGNSDEAHPVLYPPPLWLPTVADIGALLRARTKTEGGQTVGTFTDDTPAKRDQVERLIAEAVNEVSLTVNPVHIPSALYPQMRTAIALATAMSVELNFWPEQVATGRSPYAQLEARFLRIIGLLSSAAEDSDELDAGAEAGGTGYCSGGGFPTTAIGMEHPW